MSKEASQRNTIYFKHQELNKTNCKMDIVENVNAMMKQRSTDLIAK